MSDHTIKIQDGKLQFVYDDALGDLLDEGTVAVCRVSHVEPHPATGLGWVADMRPVGGPILGADGATFTPQSELPMEHFGSVEKAVIGAALAPFKTRADALAAERAWLTEHRGL
jgi:hypothetical protein